MALHCFESLLSTILPHAQWSFSISLITSAKWITSDFEIHLKDPTSCSSTDSYFPFPSLHNHLNLGSLYCLVDLTPNWRTQHQLQNSATSILKVSVIGTQQSNCNRCWAEKTLFWTRIDGEKGQSQCLKVSET